jgi:hypothetical protein
MFDSMLPAPWNYLQEFSDFFFGDDETKQKAFFGVIPYPFSPVQVVLPPISRSLTTTFAAIWSNDWDRFASYHVWSMVPFGLFARNVKNTITSPSMTVDYMTGIPLHRINRWKNQYIDMTNPYRLLSDQEKKKGEAEASPFNLGDNPFVR